MQIPLDNDADLNEFRMAVNTDAIRFCVLDLDTFFKDFECI